MVILGIIGFIVLAVLISVIPFAVYLLALAIIDDAVKDESKQDELKKGDAKVDAPSVEQIRKLCTIKHNGKDVLNVRMVCAMLGIKRIPRKEKKSIKRLIRV